MPDLSVQQNMLGQMEQAKGLAQKPDDCASAVRPGPGRRDRRGVRRPVFGRRPAACGGQGDVDVDSGRSDDLAGAMIESQKASVAFSALLQVRNKLTTAFDDVMRMPL